MRKAARPREAGTERPLGASPRAIRAHYDVGNEFYALWLDPTMTYSCALWDSETDNLESAQERKLNYHIQTARAEGQERVLDVGCGWGSCLQLMTERHGVKVGVGLTMSRAQVDYVGALRVPNVQVRLESWTDHHPEGPYDAVISIGALEHFARPGYSSEQRVQIYRSFFEKCHSILRPGGWMSLQTQAYNLGHYSEHSPLSQVFPESDMPRFHELVAGFDRLFEPELIRNDPSDYGRTVSCWLENLTRNRERAVGIVGPETYRRFDRFLRGGVKGYEVGVFLLLRMGLRRLDPLPS